ncbi:hypothetical protein EOM39_00425 [Candidatus Gracilibacteria bacterium]|nr:hypothetical protein [Candidatus Gracilibacteria bacterium]
MGNYPKAVGPYSPYIKSGNLLFCSGQIGINPESGKLVEGSIDEETKQVINNIKGVLSENGLDLTNVIKTIIFLDDMNNFTKVNEIYGEYFITKPARSTVEVSKLPVGAKIEIEVIAAF